MVVLNFDEDSSKEEQDTKRVYSRVNNAQRKQLIELVVRQNHKIK